MKARPTWFEFLLAALTLAVIAVMLYQWAQCDGTFVRTLAWFQCMAP